MRLCPFCFMKLLLANGICMIPLFVYLLYWYCIVPVICSAIHFQKSVPFFVKFQQLLVSALLSGALAFNANSLNDVRWSGQGSFPVRKRTGTLRIWRARAYMGVWGRSPLKLKAFYCRREQICHSHLLNFAAICRKGPERRSGDQKKNRNGVPVHSGSKRTLLYTDN